MAVQPGPRGGEDRLETLTRQAQGKRLLSAAEEVSLAKRIERGDLSAKERMIESNLRLVFAIARSYRGRGVPFADLVQEGSVGLVRSRGEIRSPPWTEVLHVCRMVDQTLDPRRDWRRTCDPNPAEGKPAARGRAPRRGRTRASGSAAGVKRCGRRADRAQHAHDSLIALCCSRDGLVGRAGRRRHDTSRRPGSRPERRGPVRQRDRARGSARGISDATASAAAPPRGAGASVRPESLRPEPPGDRALARGRRGAQSPDRARGIAPLTGNRAPVGAGSIERTIEPPIGRPRDPCFRSGERVASRGRDLLKFTR